MPGAPWSCAHPDQPPAGVDPHRPVTTAALKDRNGAGDEAIAAAAEQGAPAPSTVATTSTVPCDGDGTSGHRVQAMYVVAAGQTNRYTSVAASIAQWAAGVNDVINRSAALTGGVRHVRFVTSSNGDGTCSPTVLNVTVPVGANASFGSTVTAVSNLGYTSGARKYLMWVDATVLCGVAQLYPYSSDGQGNPNNGSYPQMARIDSGCWGFGNSVEAHELVHALGAVMPDAPHKTSSGHCRDESDRMCYSDGTGVTMQQVCAPENEALLDCNGDDYFSTYPVAGSYLDSHWNAADSRFLIGGGDGSGGGTLGAPTSLGMTLAVNNPALPGVATQATAALQLPTGRTAEVTWTSARTDCVFSTQGEVQTEVTCNAANTTTTTVTAKATDSTGATVSRTSALTFSAQARTASVELKVDGRDGDSYQGCTGGAATLLAGVQDGAAPLKGVAVEFLRTVDAIVTVLATATSDVDGLARTGKILLTDGATYSARTKPLTTLPTASSQSVLVDTTAGCPTELTSAVADTEVGYGTKVQVNGRLLKTSGGVTDGAAGEVITVKQATAGTTFTLGTTTTRYDGSWSTLVPLTRSGGIFAVLPAKTAYLTAASDLQEVSVATWTTAIAVNDAVDAVAYGQAVTLTGRVSRTAFNTSGVAPGLRLTVVQTRDGVADSVVGTITTRADGTFSVAVKPTWTSTLTVKVLSVAGYENEISDDVNAVTVGLGLSLTPSTTAPARGAWVSWAVRVSPARTLTVQLQRQVSGAWVNVATVPVVNGLARVSLAASTTPGSYGYRAAFGGDSGHAAASTTVRTLKIL